VSNEKTISMTVPAGSYTVTGSMYAVTGDPDDTSEVTCVLDTTNNATDNSGLVDRTVGPRPPDPISFEYDTVEAHTALTVGTGGGIISYSCSTYGDAAVSLYQARIIATRVATLTEP
jgi:hypothetical protein